MSVNKEYVDGFCIIYLSLHSSKI